MNEKDQKKDPVKDAKDQKNKKKKHKHGKNSTMALDSDFDSSVNDTVSRSHSAA